MVVPAPCAINPAEFSESRPATVLVESNSVNTQASTSSPTITDLDKFDLLSMGRPPFSEAKQIRCSHKPVHRIGSVFSGYRVLVLIRGEHVEKCAVAVHLRDRCCAVPVIDEPLRCRNPLEERVGRPSGPGRRIAGKVAADYEDPFAPIRIGNAQDREPSAVVG